MKRMKKAGLITTSVAAIAVCSSLIVGSTYALFTSDDKVDIAVTAGTVKVSAEIVESSLALTSMGVAQNGNTWENGGTAGFGDNADLTLNNITPGDAATFKINVTNESTVKIQYRLAWSVDGNLANVLEADVVGASTAEWSLWTIPQNDEEKVKEVTVSVKLPETVGNDYQGESASISFAIEAVQGNAVTDAPDITIARKGVIIDYANLSDALAGLQENDHLYINNPGEYGNLVINKNNVTVTGKVGATKAESTVFAELQTGTGAKGTTYATGVTFENLYCEYAGTNAGSTTYYTGNNVTYKNCTFVGTGSKTGTALYVHVPTITITGCTFENWNSALYTCGDNHAAADITISNNTFKNVYSPFDGYWGKKADSNTQYNIKFTDNVIENDGDAISYVQLWDYTQYLNSSDADRQGSAVKALVSGNTGAFDLYMTHANLLWATNCTLELDDNQNVVYRSLVRFEGIDTKEGYKNYAIYNADGSAMTTYNAISALRVNDGYAIAYALPTGDYKIVDNATYTAYEFSVSDPAVGTVQSVTLGEGVLDGFAYNEAANVWEISNANGLRNFAKEVNGGKTFSGAKVVLTADVNLENKLWTPIGKFEGTFDGQNHTISNLKVIGGNGVGLFGANGNGTLIIKNTKVVNAYISGTNYAGVLSGSTYATELSNNYVENATIICTPYEKGEGYDGGAKAGVLAGHVKNASPSKPTNVYGNVIKNCEVYAYRDLGGLIGCAQNENNSVMLTVYDNEISNVYVNYIDYKNYQPYDGNNVNENIGEVVGRIISANWVDVKDDNTTANVVFAKLLSDGFAEGENGNMYIYNVNGLKAWHDSVKSKPSSISGKTYTIVNDIDATGYTWESLWVSLDPIKGNFVIDGGNHTISNLTITGGNNTGLFSGSLGKYVVVKDLTFDNVTVNSTGINVGVVFGQIYNDALLENVNVINSTVAANYKVAALVGVVYDENASKESVVTLKDCLVQNTTVKAKVYDFGTCGMVGWVAYSSNESVVFENCVLDGVTLDRSGLSNSYQLHYWAYFHGVDPDNGVNEAEGLTVNDNCKVVG